jgi:4,5-dihydroxyphthalate decarboxylase
VAVPVFLSRAFRHTSIWVRKDRIHQPRDLNGKRVGVPEYSSRPTCGRARILQDDHGVQPRDITWVRGGIETPGRPEKIALALPADVRIEEVPPASHDLRSARRGRARRFHRATATGRCCGAQPAGALAVRRPDRGGAGLAPPHRHLSDHARGGRARALVQRHPWLPVAVLKAFTQAKALALDALADTSATKVTLPFRRGAAEGRARDARRRFLVVRRGRQRGDAARVPAPPPRARAVGARHGARRAV